MWQAQINQEIDSCKSSTNKLYAKCKYFGSAVWMKGALNGEHLPDRLIANINLNRKVCLSDVDHIAISIG